MEERTDLAILARGGSLSFVGSALGAVLAMALVVVLTWTLGAAEAGAFFESMALFNIVIIAVTFGADTGILRFTSRYLALDRKDAIVGVLRTGLVPVAALGLLIAAVGVVLADEIGAVLGGPDHAATVAAYVGVLAWFVPVGALNLAVLGGTRGYGTMVPTVAAERIGRPAVQLIVVGSALAAGASATGVALGWAAGFVASLAAAAVWLRRLRVLAEIPAQRAAPATTGIVREFWAFTMPRAFASMFRVGVLWLDVILVGALISPAAAAIYTVATRLLQPGILALDAIGQAVEPMFSSLLSAGQVERAKRLYQVSTGWLVALTWPIFLAVWIYADTVLGLFGSEFTEGSTAIAILAGSALIGTGFGTVDILLVMAGKSMWSFWNSAVALSLNVGLNLLLIPSLGLNGAALAWAVSRIAANVLPLLEVRSHIGFHPFGTGWFHASALSLLTFGGLGLAFRWVGGDELWALAGYLLVATPSFLLLGWRWRRPLDVSDFASLLRRRPGALQGTPS